METNYQKRIEQYSENIGTYANQKISNVLVLKDVEYVAVLGGIGDFAIYYDAFERFNNVMDAEERHRAIADMGEKIYDKTIIEFFPESKYLEYRS